MTNKLDYIPNFENKLNYIIKKIKNIPNINILELGVQKGRSTKKFIELCDLNNGHLTSVDIDDCSNVISNDKWKFIQSSDDNFEKIDQNISKNLDFIFIDSYHEPNHIKKIFYHYYKFLKVEGLCVIDDISWLPYCKNEYRDGEFTEDINRKTFQKILEIYNQNKENLMLEFFFEGSGLALITKKNNRLNEPKKIISREYYIKNLIKKLYSKKPKK
jgi:predicted O-methyltransferase YrrM